MELSIDKEFSSLIPELIKTEKDQLTLNIRDEGCRDAIVVWKNGLPDPLIIDGHNRYEICQKHNIEFKIIEKEFNGRNEALNWVIDNQLGRRNLTQDQRIYLIGKRYKGEKKDKNENLKQNTPRGQNEPSVKTAQKIAEQYKVSPATVKRAEKFADAVDTIEENIGLDAKREILAGEVKLTQKDIKEIANKPVEKQKEAYKKAKEQPTKKERGNDIVTLKEMLKAPKSFQDAFEECQREIVKAKMSSWEVVSKEVVIRYIDRLTNITIYGGKNE